MDRATGDCQVGSEHEVASQWYTAVAADSTLNSEGLPCELLRGTAPCDLLSGFGKILRTRPDDLPLQERQELIRLSSPVEGLSFFITHCWNSPGWQKYFTLCSYFLGDWAVAIGILVAILVSCGHRYFHALPELNKNDHFFNISMTVSHWELYAGMLTLWGILIFGHGFYRCSPTFLDCTCIHQADPKKKMQGITHLGNFLRVSKNLIILWDSSYFKRGWCAYELASFLALNPRGRIVVLPLKASVARLAIHVAFFMENALFLILWPYLPGMFGFLVSTGIGVACGATLALPACESYWRDVAALQAQIETFDFNEASVTVESDREAILQSINEMYPEGGVAKFNQIVQAEVLKVMLQAFSRQRCPISYRDALLSIFPGAIAGLSFHPARGLGVPCQLGTVVSIIADVFALNPLVLALYMSSVSVPTDKLQSNCKKRACKIGVILSVAVIQVAFNYLVEIHPTALTSGACPWRIESPWHGVALAIASSIPFGLACIWFYIPRSLAVDGQGRVALTHRSRHTTTNPPQQFTVCEQGDQPLDET